MTTLDNPQLYYLSTVPAAYLDSTDFVVTGPFGDGRPQSGAFDDFPLTSNGSKPITAISYRSGALERGLRRWGSRFTTKHGRQGDTCTDRAYQLAIQEMTFYALGCNKFSLNQATNCRPMLLLQSCCCHLAIMTLLIDGMMFCHILVKLPRC